MNKHRANRPNNQSEPIVTVHSSVGYIQQHSGWRKIREQQDESDQLFEQMAQDSQ